MNVLQLGIKAFQSGDLETAKQHFLKQLSLVPNDPNAKQLLGLVYSSLGDLDRAIESMQQSLTINSKQPHVLNNLGLCQKRVALTSQAIVSFTNAIKLQKDYIDPYQNLISILLETSQLEAAKSWVNKALAMFPNDARILRLSARHYQESGNYSLAIEQYEALLATDSNSTLLKHSLAVTLRMAGQPAKALKIYDELEKLGMNQFEFFHNMGNALSDVGQLRPAIDYYRKSIAANPAYVKSHKNLNELLWELEDRDEFLLSYGGAFKLAPQSMELRFSYASTLVRVGEYQQSYDVLKQLPEEARNHYEYYELIGLSLKGLGRTTESIQELRKVLSFENASAEALLQLAQSMIEDAQYQSAEEIIEKALALDPENKFAWALLGICWGQTGDSREKVLNDYDNLVREYTIEIPDGFTSVEHFCAELNTYLATLHTANRAPLEQTLTGGTQTRGNLFDHSNSLIEALIDKVKLCVDDYIDATEPFMQQLPVLYNSKSYHFSGSWSVRLQEQGFHTPHVHPMGWLSSAFYVQLPSAVDNEDAKEGWFKLGENNCDVPTSSQRFVRPKVGKLILFQAYMWHGTLPFLSGDTRTSIAFDVARGE